MTAIDLDLASLSRAEKIALVEGLEEKRRRFNMSMFYRMYPDVDTSYQIDNELVTIHAREKYAKHMEFFEAGAKYRERCAMCANRVGKTFGMGGYETSVHLTGLYPEWWPGKRFSHPTRFWAAGKTNETTRDIVQATLLGGIDYSGARKIVVGNGVIPGDKLGVPNWKQGVSDLVDTIKVKHVSGDWSVLGLKSYQQGRGSFEGTAQHGIWMDEEPPLDIYGECLIRTATTNGILMLTFTPLEGLSETVLQFMEPRD